MKKLYVLFCILLAAAGAHASHIVSMDIRVEYTGSGNLYRTKLNILYDCSSSFLNSPAAAQQVLFSGTACGMNFNRYVGLVSVDTLRSMWCPGTVTGCSSANPNYLVGRYSDTVTLVPCSAWKIGADGGPRNAGIINLTNPGSADLYVEAMLNNSTAPNSTPVFDDDPHIFSVNNTVSTHPFHVTDIDGDSIAAAMIQPMGSGGAAVPYTAPYSVSSPMGAGGYPMLNIAAGIIQIFGVNQGRYALAARVYDYRNGALAGYSSRDWAHMIIAGTNPKDPLPAAGSTFSTTACPGSAGSFTVHFIDSTATDSVYLQLTPPSNGITYTTTYTPGVGSAYATISWTTPASYNVAANPYFSIKVNAHDNACPLRGYAGYNIIVRAAYCGTDTVWAGDANADKVVDMYDPLAIAVAWGSTGAVRIGASTAWAPQWCANWGASFINGINYKHADCDGNGTVGAADLTAVTANYASTHPRQFYQQGAKQTGLPDLYYDATGVNMAPGATVSIPVMLGSTATPATVYGLAARLRVSGINLVAAPAVTYPASSWLGTGVNTVRFSKGTTTASVDWAYARNNQTTATGGGQLATISFMIPAGTPNGQKIILTMEQVKMISQTGAELTNYNVLSDTVTVHSLGVGNTASPIVAAAVVPNPSQGAALLQISLAGAVAWQASVTDITGRIVWTSALHDKQAGAQEIALPQGLQPGLYLVHISAGENTEVLKWLCE